VRTIWKFPLPVADRILVDMPFGAKVLTAQRQGPFLCLWAEVYSDRSTVSRIFRVFGTGHEMPAEFGYEDRYVGTVQFDGLVWHVYEQLS